MLLTTLNSQIAPVASGAFPVFRPSGGKYVGQIVPGDTYSEGPITDTVDFNTLPYLLAGNVGYTAPTGDVGTGYLWRHTPTPYVTDACLSYVVAEGVSGAVYAYTNVIVPDLNFHFMRTGASTTGGRILGRKQLPGTAITTPTRVQGRAVNSIRTGIWVSTTWSGLGIQTLATPVTGDAVRLSPHSTPQAPPPLDFTWRHNSVFAPWFALDDSQISFEGTLDGAIDAGFSLIFPADVDVDKIAGPVNFGNLEAGDRLFFKMLTTGGLIDPVTPGTERFAFEINMCGQVSAVPRRGADGNVRSWQWDFIMVPDDSPGGSGLPFEAYERNLLASIA